MEVLKKQYALVQQSRAVVLNFVESTVGEDLNTPVPALLNQTIRDLLLHSIQCYFYWLEYVSGNEPIDWFKSLSNVTLSTIRELYGRVNQTMADFLENYKDQMDEPINSQHLARWHERATPLQVFTQVTTHEFHHKGQIMLMCRLLGYPPPETDVSLFF